MKPFADIFRSSRVQLIETGEDGGAFWFRTGGEDLLVIVSNGLGWDHTSVSKRESIPTWQEMCAVRDLVFLPDEWVVQFHPPKAFYVNFHPRCLHLWRRQEGTMATPPTDLIGPLTDPPAPEREA